MDIQELTTLIYNYNMKKKSLDAGSESEIFISNQIKYLNWLLQKELAIRKKG